MDTIQINGEDYVKKSSIPGHLLLSDVRIIVADRGWIFVGNCEDHSDGTVTITNCKNIRRWGTKAGLGELVNGPKQETVFDNYGTVKCLPLVMIAVIKGW